MKVTIPHGDPDLGAEVDLEITFEFRKGSNDHWDRRIGTWLPGDPAELEFLSCKGPLEGNAYDKYRQDSFDMLAEFYLESDDGQTKAMEEVASDDAAAREYAAELRADR